MRPILAHSAGSRFRSALSGAIAARRRRRGLLGPAPMSTTETQAPIPAAPRATQRRGNGLPAYLIAVAVVALDQASKYWIVNGLQLGEGSTMPVFGPFH